MIQQKVKRIIYIDLIKGIAVFLVIWGHCIQNLNILAFDVFENQAFRFIYSFHMPLFMLISGYLFYFSINKYTTISLLSSRVKTLVIPAVSCGIITWLIQYILYDNRNVDSIFTEIRNVWFLWAVFIASILVGIIHIKFKEYKFHWVIHFIIFIALFLIPSVFIDYKSLYVYPYFIIGFMFNEFKGKNNNKLYNIRYFSLILYPLLLTMFHKNIFIYTTKINMFTSIYGIKKQLEINILRWTVGLVGSVFIMVLVEILIKSNFLNKLFKFLFAKIGKVSLQLYIIQRPLLEVIFTFYYQEYLLKKGLKIFPKSIFLYNYCWTIFISSVFVIFIYWIIKLINKSERMKYILFGGR